MNEEDLSGNAVSRSGFGNDGATWILDAVEVIAECVDFRLAAA
jgi:hypothetical protein